ncbi:MAG: ATP-binding protein [Bacteroidetes bacterium]|nr:ATP-binding protein [Bacteroidota bacterium]
MKKLLTSNIKLKIIITFLLALSAFIVVQFISNKSIENVKGSFKQISENKRLSKMASNVVSSIKSYHRSIIEFVLTGNDEFLYSNEKNLSNANFNLQNIIDAPKNTEESVLISQLDSLVKSEINFCQQALITYHKENRKDVIALINTGKGEQLINDINKVFINIQQVEDNNLIHIAFQNDSFIRSATQMDYAATCFAIVVILFSILIIFRDINRRVLVEKQLRFAQQKAEQSAIMKEQFMANMSHEIRTPMNAIIGFANLLSKTKLDEKQTRQLKAIQTSGENLLNIINDILDFSKIEAGMVSIEKIPFSPAALLHSVNTMFAPKAKDKKIQFDFYTPTELPQAVIGDPARLTQILLNLINNAIKFTSEGSISVKTELVSEENDNVTIQFTVKDTGIGIPKEKLDEIFERFTQANTDTSRKYGGSGLGLSITKKLIELQGGTIHVQSAEGVGSSFSFSIQYKKTAASIRPERIQPTQPKLKTKLKILVAEDNILNQHLAESLLTQWGFEFDIVENGKIAIEKLKQKEFDLMLMDIQMPEMNGYDAAHHIRKNLQLNLPIIAMTAHVLPGEKDKCLSYGMTDYISKPIRESELFDLISKYIGTNNEKDVSAQKTQQEIDKSGGLINLDYVYELSNGNSNFVTEMIDLFLTENPKEIQLFESAVYKKDMEAIKAIAHKINSTVPFVGLNLIIGHQLSSIEKLAEDKTNLHLIEKLFLQVKETCLQAIEELNYLKTNHA